jgi:hypothetical protein
LEQVEQNNQLQLQWATKALTQYLALLLVWAAAVALVIYRRALMADLAVAVLSAVRLEREIAVKVMLAVFAPTLRQALERAAARQPLAEIALMELQV